MVRRKPTTKLHIGKRQSDQKPKQYVCSLKDIMTGFWIGMAIAAIYLNVRRKPAITSHLTEKPSSTSSPLVATVPPLSVVSLSPAKTEAPLPPVQVDASPLPPSQVDASVTFGKINNPWSVTSIAGERDFYEIATKTNTDKVWGQKVFETCKDDLTTCGQPTMKNPKCRVLQGHFYATIYNRWLRKYSTDDAEPIQFLEIGFYQGHGYDAYKEFLPRAETHSIEIACIEPGPREEGKWPWPNFPESHPKYKEYLDTNQLHCGDASDYDYLEKVWTTHMKRPDAPPLKVVVEDAAHIDSHMAMSLFFWFPRIEPGGVLIIEDIQPMGPSTPFRTNVLSQVLKDIHYCGDPEFSDRVCFPTIQPLLQSIHCEMHICVFERNDKPAVEYDKDLSVPPPHALNAADCLLHSS